MSNTVGLGYSSSRTNSLLHTGRYTPRDYSTTSFDRTYRTGSFERPPPSPNSALNRAKYGLSRTSSLDYNGSDIGLSRDYSSSVVGSPPSPSSLSSSSYHSPSTSYDSGYGGPPSPSRYKSRESEMTVGGSRKSSVMGNLLKKVRSSSLDYGPPASSPSKRATSIYRRPTPPRRSPSNSQDYRRKQYQQNLMWYSQADADDVPIEAYLDELNIDTGNNYFDYEEAQKRRISSSRGDSVSRADSMSRDSITREISLSRGSSVSRADSVERMRSALSRSRSPYRDVSPSVVRRDTTSFDCENGIDDENEDIPKSKPLKTSLRSKISDLKNIKFNREKSSLKQKTLDDMYKFYMGDDYVDPLKLPDENKSPEPKAPKTRFKEDVNVMLYDKEVGSMSESNSVKLKEEKKKPKVEVTQNGVSNGNKLNGDGTSSSLPEFKPDSIEVISDSMNPRKRKLRIRSKIDSDYARNKTSVKALSGGLKLIILLYKFNTDKESEFDLSQITKELHLPHRVDAFSVRAVMDKLGCLNIEAPIIEISPGRKALSDSDKSSETSAESTSGE